MENLNEKICELELECTTLCNAKCPLCYRNYKSFANSVYSKPYIRDLRSVIQQLEQMPNLKFVMLVGSMSEPTLYPSFIDLVAYLKSRYVNIEICTNGDTQNMQFWTNLGEVLSDDDKVYFTICGATQEIHQVYRVGTNLQNITQNAAWMRSVRKIDYVQCIRFNYNSEHFDSMEFKQFVGQFSHVYMTETFYPKSASFYEKYNDIEKFLPSNVKLSQYDKIRTLAENRYSSCKHRQSDCTSLRRNRYQMDVFGNIFPCYLLLEYLNGKRWSMEMDDLYHVNHECCKFCDKVVQQYAKRYNLEYVI